MPRKPTKTQNSSRGRRRASRATVREDSPSQNESSSASPEPENVHRRLGPEEVDAMGIAFVDARNNRIRYPYHTQYPPIRIVQARDLKNVRPLQESIIAAEGNSRSSNAASRLEGGHAGPSQTASTTPPPIAAEASPPADPSLEGLFEDTSSPGVEAGNTGLNSDSEEPDNAASNIPGLTASQIEDLLPLNPLNPDFTDELLQPDDAGSSYPVMDASQAENDQSLNPLYPDHASELLQPDDAGGNIPGLTACQIEDMLPLNPLNPDFADELLQPDSNNGENPMTNTYQGENNFLNFFNTEYTNDLLQPDVAGGGNSMTNVFQGEGSFFNPLKPYDANNPWQPDGVDGDNPMANANQGEDNSLYTLSPEYISRLLQPDGTADGNIMTNASQAEDNFFSPLNPYHNNNFSQPDSACSNDSFATAPQIDENLFLTSNESASAVPSSITATLYYVDGRQFVHTSTPYYTNDQLAPSPDHDLEQTMHEVLSNVPIPNPEDILSWDQIMEMAISPTQRPRDSHSDDVKIEDLEDEL